MTVKGSKNGKRRSSAVISSTNLVWILQRVSLPKWNSKGKLSGDRVDDEIHKDINAGQP